MNITFSDISHMSLFRKLDKNLVRVLDVFFTEKKYPDQTCLVREGEQQENFYLIISGEVEVSEQVEAKKIILNHLSAGQFFGEMNLFDPGIATASVFAVTPVRTLEISNQKFRDFITQKPELAADFTFQLAQTTARRYRQSTDRIQQELTSPEAIRLGEQASNKTTRA